MLTPLDHILHVVYSPAEGSVLVKKIPEGSLGIAQTVAAILALAHDPRSTPKVREIALMVCKSANTGNDDFKRAKAIHDWLKAHVTYVRDPTYREFVQPPLNILDQAIKRTHMAAGDCDDFCSVTAALCGSLGLPTRVSLTEDPKNRSKDGDPWWAHVYCEVLTKATPSSKDKLWIPLDSSLWFLKFGQRVLGRTTHIYPGDIHIDVLLDASRKYKGLGFVEAVIDKTSPRISQVMRSRVVEAKVRGPVVEGLDVSGRQVSGLGIFGLDIIDKMLSPIVGVTKALIGANTAKIISRTQAKAMAAKARAEGRLQEKFAELDFASGQLSSERQARSLAELAAFNRLRDQEEQDRKFVTMAIGLPLAALAVFGIVKKLRS